MEWLRHHVMQHEKHNLGSTFQVYVLWENIT